MFQLAYDTTSSEKQSTVLPLTIREETKKRRYKKSTNGCTTCKARKIKARPICGNCAKHFLAPEHCSYGLGIQPAAYHASLSKRPKGNIADSRARVIAPLPTGISYSARGIDNASTSRLLELRLVYNYATANSGRGDRISKMPFPPSLWEVKLPQLAFASPMVLNALLGISAQHLGSINPSDEEALQASKLYYHKALVDLRTALSHVDAQNAEEVMLTSVVISHIHWLMIHSSDASPYRVNSDTYRLCEGTLILIKQTELLLKGSDWDTRNQKPILQCPVIHTGFLKAASDDIEKLTRSFEHLDLDEECRLSYRLAAKELHSTTLLLAGNSPDVEQEAVVIPHKVPRRFMRLLIQHDPIALAILARTYAILGLCQDKSAWWIHGVGQNLVAQRSIPGIRTLMPEDWLWTMDWPESAISGELTLEGDE